MIMNKMDTLMDRRVKERLVGATILVVLIVLIVPELLSGPHRPSSSSSSVSLPVPTRNVSVDLTTSGTSTPRSAESTPASAALPPEPPSAPPSVATLGAQAQTGSGLETRPSTAKSAVSNEAQSLPARDSWSVQLGSFSSKANADKLVHQLKARGMPAYIISSGSGSSSRFRVRVGPMPDRETAEREVQKLKAAGHTAAVVAPAP
ncbi:MAG: SPOR domain-containing protein [Steroidobacteraceae bacterium]